MRHETKHIYSQVISQKVEVTKSKASAGIEPTTFPLLGERTADYAKRPYKDKEDKNKRI